MGPNEFDTSSVNLAMEAEPASDTARQQGEAAVRKGSADDALVSARGTELEKLTGLDEAETKA